MPEQKQIKVKVPENILPGVYSNQMVVSHTREEFVLDFANLFPPEGIVNARVIVSPGISSAWSARLAIISLATKASSGRSSKPLRLMMAR